MLQKLYGIDCRYTAEREVVGANRTYSYVHTRPQVRPEKINLLFVFNNNMSIAVYTSPKPEFYVFFICGARSRALVATLQ